LYRTSASAYVGDQHPGYLSSDWAQKRAKQNKVPFIQVQHHHAHAASLIADNQYPSDEAIIACVLDGTGYGDDGNIWGGEILIADACSYRRVAHLQYAPLPGGDRCIRQPARTALAYLYAAEIAWHDELQCRSCFSDPDLNLLRQQLQKQINVVQTSSMGRLFDAVASLLGLRHSIDYEGQAASELEALAETAVRGGASESVPGYAFPWSSSKPSQLNYGPLLSAICAELQKGADLAMVALKFHVAVARAFTEQCLRVQAEELAMSQGRKLDCVGLTGGVFQNTLLLRLMQDCLTREGFRVLTHSVVPPNDGGLALGQALIGRERLKRSMT
jgi:hydrogenase maturation protein HypF